MYSETDVALAIRFARLRWPDLDRESIRALAALVRGYGFSIETGDALLIGSCWYITHAGLLRLARRRHCARIDVQTVGEYCDPRSSRWTFKAIVYRSRTCKGFVGYGDADPSNVSPLVRGAEMRVAETRAVNRALRKAYGIGICSVEELGALSRSSDRGGSTNKLPPRPAVSNGNGNGNGQPKLRDRLCLLIRQHHLDPVLVKRFATDFCAVPDLRQANRDQVEALVKHITEFANNDLAGLTAKLNSYAEKQEGAGAA